MQMIAEENKLSIQYRKAKTSMFERYVDLKKSKIYKQLFVINL